MPIDFSAPANRDTYGGRRADGSWRRAVVAALAAVGTPGPEGLHVVDVGCGAGVYSLAWAELGAARVIGVDSSAVMLDAAREATAGVDRIRLHQADAAATGLRAHEADVVFERALVHHVPDLGAVVAEAVRLLRPGGAYVVQDRTMDDVRLPGSPRHPRGYLVERFPRLLEVEGRRRPDAAGLAALLRAEGLDVRTSTVWETRAVHPDRETYLQEIRERRGRSVLHELDDAEIGLLVDLLAERLPAGAPVREADRWTLWVGRATPRRPGSAGRR